MSAEDPATTPPEALPLGVAVAGGAAATLGATVGAALTAGARAAEQFKLQEI